MTKSPSESESRRLEGLWSGEFGCAYTERNEEAGLGREPFWRDLLAEIEVTTVLEVGCNVGANLRWLAELLEPRNVYGVDVNEDALARVRRSLEGVNALFGTARELPFRDRFFDLTFTTGVLIHVSPSALPLAMAELVRSSGRYVLCGEYYAEEPVEVPYHGETGALFKRDFGRLYLELFPELALLRQGFLGREDGWDDVTWWLFERT
jgi:spore coat polysaccharide biosynthesis protein SpsF